MTGPPRADGAERYRRLLEAHHTIADDLSLTSVLDRTLRAACDLLDTQYGALCLVAADGSVEHLAHRGFDGDMVGRIGRPPRSGELLAASLSSPRPVRVDDLTTDPRYDRFPPPGPTMRSFLSVPIQARGAVLGELYVLDPLPGRFDAEDQDLVVSLANTAGTAVENSRLHDEARRSRDWLNASGEIARALIADDDEEVLLDVVTQALGVAEADLACLILPTEDQQLQVTVAMGLGAERARGAILDPARSTLAKTIMAEQSMRTHDVTLWTDVDFDNRHDFGPAMIVPLLDAQGSRGAMLMLRRQGLPFTLHDVDVASTFAAQVALAMELNDTRAEAEWVRVLEDRHRIAQDLHDNVMQRLFATGVGLQALAEQQADAALSERLRRHIVDLDETIDEIRTRVFGLRDDAELEPRRRRNRFPHVARAAVAAARNMGSAAARSLTPRGQRRDQAPGILS
ncbi:MAG: GAF domain-containing protein [Jatrophihabitans sp.]